MGNEKYLNYYVEILTNTLTDAVIKNISLQANARVTEEVINEQVVKNEKLTNELQKFLEDKNNSENTKITNLEQLVQGHLDTINQLTKQVTDLNAMRNEYESVKHQAQHVDTFRNELVKEREEHQKTRNDYDIKIKELSDKIKYLQLTPAKRKKIDEVQTIKTVEVLEESSVLPLVDETIRDGGSF